MMRIRNMSVGRGTARIPPLCVILSGERSQSDRTESKFCEMQQSGVEQNQRGSAQGRMTEEGICVGFLNVCWTKDIIYHADS